MACRPDQAGRTHQTCAVRKMALAVRNACVCVWLAACAVALGTGARGGAFQIGALRTKSKRQCAHPAAHAPHKGSAQAINHL